MAAASTRLVTPSFLRMVDTCTLAVLVLMNVELDRIRQRVTSAVT